MKIENHTFLVTGGASGLGAACVRMLAGANGNVVIADVNRTAGEAAADGRAGIMRSLRQH